MKTFIQSLAISLIVHVLFIIGFIVIGYTKTKSYSPDITTRAYEQSESLQHTVSFGTTFSPYIFIFTFFGLALVFSLIILAVKKYRLNWK